MRGASASVRRNPGSKLNALNSQFTPILQFYGIFLGGVIL